MVSDASKLVITVSRRLMTQRGQFHGITVRRHDGVNDASRALECALLLPTSGPQKSYRNSPSEPLCLSHRLRCDRPAFFRCAALRLPTSAPPVSRHPTSFLFLSLIPLSRAPPMATCNRVRTPSLLLLTRRRRRAAARPTGINRLGGSQETGRQG